MADTLETLTDSETEILNAARECGALREIDARADGRRDAEPLADAARVGRRIADGFAFMRGEW